MKSLAFLGAISLSALGVLAGCNTQTTSQPVPQTVAATSADDKSTTCPSPLPDDINVVAPGTDVPDAMRQLSGVWANGSWNGGRCGALVVEAIKPEGSATVVYSWGDGNRDGNGDYRRIPANIDQNGVLSLSFPGSSVRVSYTLLDSEQLAGTYYRSGKWSIALTKVGG